MMMRRIIAAMVALSVALCQFPALGESKENVTIRTLNMYWYDAVSLEPLREVLSYIALENSYIAYENEERNVQQYLMAHSQEWDVAYIRTDECSIKSLYQAGLIMDIGQQEAMEGVYDGMFPRVLEGLSYEGSVYGVPMDLSTVVMQMGIATYDGVRSQLGFSMEDAPQTFQEYCQLALWYMQLPENLRKGIAFHIDGSAEGYAQYMLRYFIDLYTAEFCDAEGNITYDTDTFRQGLKDTLSMCEALQKDAKVAYGVGSVYGFTRSWHGGVFSEKADNALYLHIGDAAVVPASLGMVVVNQNTKHLPEALEVAKQYADFYAVQFQASFQTLDDAQYEALFHRFYDDTIQVQDTQSVIAELEKGRATGSTVNFFTKEDADEYAQNIAPFLTFPLVPRVDSDGLIKQYQTGVLDEDGLIQALQQAANELVVWHLAGE